MSRDCVVRLQTSSTLASVYRRVSGGWTTGGSPNTGNAGFSLTLETTATTTNPSSLLFLGVRENDLPLVGTRLLLDPLIVFPVASQRACSDSASARSRDSADDLDRGWIRQGIDRTLV